MNTDSDSTYTSYPSSYGSAGVLPMSDEDKAKAEERKRPIGFVPPAPPKPPPKTTPRRTR